MECPICMSQSSTVMQHPTRDAQIVKCPQCEEFTVSGSAAADITARQRKQSWKISAWLVQYKPEILTTADIEGALKSVAPSLHIRAERMLRWLNEKFPPGKSFSVFGLGSWEHYKNDPNDSVVIVGGHLKSSPLVPIGWNHDVDEMIFMVTEVLCNELGLLVSQNNHEYQVSPKGLIHLEGRKNENSTIGFCAMWFNDEVKPLWTEVIEPAIRAAGYEPLRIDSKQHNGKIDDEIMASIRASRFVVADFTGNRGGVYYEAGFAHGLNLPVIFMCRDGDLLHFDIRQYNCIFWTANALDDARLHLKNRILATLGQGPLKVQKGT